MRFQQVEVEQHDAAEEAALRIGHHVGDAGRAEPASHADAEQQRIDQGAHRIRHAQQRLAQVGAQLAVRQGGGRHCRHAGRQVHLVHEVAHLGRQRQDALMEGLGLAGGPLLRVGGDDHDAYWWGGDAPLTTPQINT